jgi:hypothetical protein
MLDPTVGYKKSVLGEREFPEGLIQSNKELNHFRAFIQKHTCWSTLVVVAEDGLKMVDKLGPERVL